MFEVLVAVCALLLIGPVAARFPPRWAPFDRIRPRRYFHGLVLFGESGASVVFRRKGSEQLITFVKRVVCTEQWDLEVLIERADCNQEVYSVIENRLAVLRGDQVNALQIAKEKESPLSFRLWGAAVSDSSVLENVSRMVLRCLGNSEMDRYRVSFVGPRNDDKITAYLKTFYSDAFHRLRRK